MNRLAVDRRQAVGKVLPVWLFLGLAAGNLFAQQDISQSLLLNTTETFKWHGVRGDSPLNIDNWQDSPTLEFNNNTSLFWTVQFGQRLLVSVQGSLDWDHNQGSDLGDLSRYHPPLPYLDEALASLNIYEIGLRLNLGKTIRRFGSAVIMPVLDVLTEEVTVANKPPHGKWLVGASFSLDFLGAEFWYGPFAPWLPDVYLPVDERQNRPGLWLATVSAMIDVHRLGLLFYHDGGASLGLWYSGQIGEVVLPYLEVLLADHRLVSDIANPQNWARPGAKSIDVLVGTALSPPDFDATLYLEYRFRSSGYSSGDLIDLRSQFSDDRRLAAINRPIMGQVTMSFPYLKTARHTVGLRIRSTRLIAEFFEWNFTAFWLAPDGLMVRAEAIANVVDRLKIIAGGAVFQSFADPGYGNEFGWWKNTWQFDLALSWTAGLEE